MYSLAPDHEPDRCLFIYARTVVALNAISAERKSRTSSIVAAGSRAKSTRSAPQATLVIRDLADKTNVRSASILSSELWGNDHIDCSR